MMMPKKPTGYSLNLVFWCIVTALVAAGAIGWALNIIAIVRSVGDGVSGMLIARLVGVVAAPLGAVLGYL